MALSDERLDTKTPRDEGITDTERLDYMQAHPEKFIRYHKGKWAFLGFTNYEFDMHPTLREAIDAAVKTTKRV